MAGVGLEVAAERLAGVAAPEAVGAEGDEGARDPTGHLVGDRLHVVADGDVGPLGLRQRLGYPGGTGRLRWVEAVPALGRQRLFPQGLVRRRRPQLGAHVVVLGQLVAGLGGGQPGGAGEHDGGPHRWFCRSGGVAVEPPQDARLAALRHLGHGVVLVVEGEVVEDVFVVGVHPTAPVGDDHCQLVGEGGVVHHAVGHHRVEQRAVPVLVLQPLAVERGAPGSGTEQETPAPRVGKGPHQVAGALIAEHGIEDVEGQHGDAVGGVSRPGGGEAGHGAGFGDALLEDLAGLRLPVAEKQIGVDRLVLLAQGGVDADLPEQRVQPEGSGLVGDDGHHPLAHVGVAHQVAQHPGEHHGGGGGLGP